jgi:hypothetical protein
MPFYELKQLIRDALACRFDATNKLRVIRLGRACLQFSTVLSVEPKALIQTGNLRTASARQPPSTSA